MRIFYLCPDEEKPSWGVGMIYSHVRLLNRFGQEAYVVHDCPDFSLSWLNDKVPCFPSTSLTTAGVDDILVVPEVLASDSRVKNFRGRRVVFVQGGFLIQKGLGLAADYTELGFEKAIVILPHIASIVERFYGLEAHIIPPFIAPYFFNVDVEGAIRKRRILLVPKAAYLQAGFLDYPIVKSLLRGRLPDDWILEELAGIDHTEVARKMLSSTFLVCVNSHEGFNSTVPEAMAAGCIPLCYRGFGGRDFLDPEKNAVVVENNDVYTLVERVLVLTREAAELEHFRREGYKTASRFTEKNTETALLEFWEGMSFG